ncbi:hypothetical protein [Streptomyces sp. NPDC053048]|uniref:hypothetical protein n=1 Tax=Streptomyces sp. NPDC053048 TaxID=3365694 RepID=UPI0037CFA155
MRDFLLLERESRLTGRFFTRVDNLGQRVLRSPYEHHPGAEGHRDCEMLDFARLHWPQLTEVEQHEVRMAQSGQRGVAPIDIFESYCSHVAASHEVTARARRAEVLEVAGSDEADVNAAFFRPEGRAIFTRRSLEYRGLPLVHEETMELAGTARLYVMGALASLALGPAARNIDGHRVAAARITAALRARRAGAGRPGRSNG